LRCGTAAVAHVGVGLASAIDRIEQPRQELLLVEGQDDE
jgi:hypothetical protein